MHSNKPHNPDALLLGINATADRLSVCPNHVRKMVKVGELKTVRVGSRIRIPVAELNDFIARNIVITPVSEKGNAPA